jgi:glycosyltransferase involved in cell wall biosynthesis
MINKTVISNTHTDHTNRLLKAMHITTQNEPCGIATYTAAFVEAMNSAGASDQIFNISPNILRQMPKQAFIREIARLCTELTTCDILHIQHEYSFFSTQQLKYLIQQVRAKTHVKIIVTLHTAPSVSPLTKVSLFRPRTWIIFRRSYAARQDDLKKTIFVRDVDMLIVHNNFTRHQLEAEFNVDPEKIVCIPIPVLPVPMKMNQCKICDTVTTELNIQKNDILFCTIGFLSLAKGIHRAIKTLKLLPQNYKLLIIGGIHPKAGNDNYLDRLFELAQAYGLGHRIYITGYVSKAEQTALLSMCQFAVFHYQRGYLSSSGAVNDALALGIPAIATSIPAFLEINERIQCLKLTQDFSYYTLTQTIREIMGDPELVQSLKNAEHEYVQQNSIPILARKWRAIYDQVTQIS